MDKPNPVLAALFACACVVPQRVQAADNLPIAAFVVLGQSGKGEQVALARVLIDKAGADCPTLQPLQGKGQKQAMRQRLNPDPAHFQVTVCEAQYPMDGTRMAVSGTALRLPAVPAQVSRVAVFGDSGCLPSHQNGCNRVRDWPFAVMATAAANAAPDLVLHMGDYNYRGTPGNVRIKRGGNKAETVSVYDAGDNAPGVSCTLNGPYFGQNSPGSETPDSWPAWKADFFAPAAKLLGAAPWIFARGNHELCSRAGPGYFYFLDIGSDLVGDSGGQLVCPPAESAEPLVFRGPYRVDLGGLSVVVLDSANACDRGSIHQDHFNAQFQQIQSLVGKAPAANAVWLQSHRPLWGLQRPEQNTPKTALDTSGRYAVIDKTLQTAFASYPVPNQVHLVLSGHMHRFQTLDFEAPSALPTQLIVGNSGVALARNFPEGLFSLAIDDATAVGFGLSEFGYMDIALRGGGAWKGRILDRRGKLLARCDSAQPSKTGACAPVSK